MNCPLFEPKGGVDWEVSVLYTDVVFPCGPTVESARFDFGRRIAVEKEMRKSPAVMYQQVGRVGREWEGGTCEGGDL